MPNKKSCLKMGDKEAAVKLIAAAIPAGPKLVTRISAGSDMPSPKCQFMTCAGFGGGLTLVGAILLGVWSPLFDAIANWQLALSPNSYSFSMWEDVPIPLYMDFYYYNWTNPETINHPNSSISKPILVELGPYVFSEKREKVILHWDNVNNLVTYRVKKTWHFEPNMSRGSLDDVITTLNVPAVAAVFAIRNTPHLKLLLNWAMNLVKIPISVKRTVGELLFDGYRNILMDIAWLLPDGFLPVIIPFQKFGWFHTRNESETYEGVYTMHTGKGDMDQFGKVSLWNYENPTPFYQGRCGLLNGSAGELFPPKPKKGGDITLFTMDLCRSLTLNYKEERETDGLTVYRYWGDEHIFDNLTVKPENWCFCPSGECPPHGAIDIGPCKWDTPAYVSFPHFLHGDPSYREAVHGMRPNENLHQMYVDLEKRTGLPVQVAASLQINMLMRPYPEYTLFKNVPKIYFPTFWFQQRVKIDDDIASTMRLVTRIPTAGYILWGATVISGIAILVIVGIYYREYRRKGTFNKI